MKQLRMVAAVLAVLTVATAQAKVVLPSWAPKNPSKELLRAAEVLKPVPQEVQPYDSLYVPAWEFFGSLTDAQIATFAKATQVQWVAPPDWAPEQVARVKERMGVREEGGKLVYYTHEILVPYGDLTPDQRRAFDRVAKAWPNPEKQERADLLVQLYKLGAKKDLSNVEVGFTAIGGHGVKLEFRVHAVVSQSQAEGSGDTVTTNVTMATAGFGELVAYL